MKKFDVVFAKGRLEFSELNVPAVTADEAVEAVRAKHGWMFERLVLVARVDHLFTK